MAGVALLALTVKPSLSLAQDKPDCVKSRTVGQWKATGFDDFWTVEQKAPNGFEITVFNTFVTVDADSLKQDKGRYFFDDIPVVRIAISVDGEPVATASADGFERFRGSDHDLILEAFRAGRSAILAFVVEGGTSFAGEFSLLGFTRAVGVASRLRDEMAQLEAANKCEPLDCFLTEAACGAVGLADDCWELTTLRRFRDHALVALPGGRADVAEYYRLGPSIVAAIAARPDARRRLLALYWTCIVPCCALASIGAADACRRLYRVHFARLQQALD
jgi:hypothetical protein